VSGTDALTQTLSALFPGMVQNMQANAYYLRGAARQASGDTDGALSDFNQAISAAPDFAAVYNNRGVIKGMMQRDADGALSDFNKAAELQSKAPDTYANRGNIKLAMGQIDEALKDYDKAVELSPSWAAAYFDRAFGKQQKGDLDGAIADLNKAIELKADYLDAYYNRAVDYDRKQQFGEAIADYDRVIVMNPNAADAFAGRGMDKYRRNDIEGSVSDFNRAIALRKDSVRLYLDRAAANEIKGDNAAAISDFDQVLKLADDDTSAYPRLFRCVALLQTHSGDPKKDLAAAIANWKDTWPKKIGQFLTGDLTESQFLAAAEIADPKIVAAHRCDAFYFTGIAHLLTGDTAAARSFFSECVAVNRPDLFASRFAQGELDRLKPAQ
jgi:tetratricopeptide (TPR) repeat protein